MALRGWKTPLQLLGASLAVARAAGDTCGTPAAVIEDDLPAEALSLLQFQLSQASASEATAATGSVPPIFSMVPAGDLVCLQGAQRTLQAALASLQASPLSELYQQSAVMPQSCTSRGFPSSDQEPDHCFWATTTWTRHGAEAPGGEAEQWSNLKASHLAAYDAAFELENGTAGTIVNCSCPFFSHDGQHMLQAGTQGPSKKSTRRRPRRSACEGLADLTGSWVPDNGVMCLEGPLDHLEFVLTTLKASPLAALHLHNMVEARNCTERGFTTLLEGEDHCYPPAVLYYNDPDVLMSMLGIEEDVMLAYDQEHGLKNYTASYIAGCNCVWGSEVREQIANHSAEIPRPYRVPDDLDYAPHRSGECADMLLAHSPFESQEFIRRAELQLPASIHVAPAAPEGDH